MKLPTTSFRGMAPRVTPRALPANGAQRAVNAKLLSGDLEAWRRPGFVEMLANDARVRSIFKLSTLWLSYAEEVEFARSTIPGDTSYMTFITGLDLPRFTTLEMAQGGSVPPYPGETRPLGVPGPDSAPTVVADIVEPPEDALPLVNPGAELGNTVGWTATLGGMVAVANGSIPGFNAQTGSFFFGGGAVDASESYQAVDLDAAGVISGQGLRLTWWQATNAAGDLAAMSMAFYSDTAVLLSTIDADLEAPDTPLTWVQRTLQTQVPDGAVTVRLIQRFQATTGSAVAASYIDTIALQAIDYANSFDGSSLAGWTQSPNEGSESSDRHRIVRIDDSLGWPPPSFYMRCDERVAFFYRDFSTDKSPAVTLTFDYSENQTRTNSGLHVVLFGSASGVATSVFFSTWGGLRLYSHPQWLGVGASVQTLIASPPFRRDRRYTVTINAALVSTTQANLTITVVDTTTGDTLVNGQTATIPIDGPYIGFKGGPGTLHNRWVVDNVAVVIAAPDPTESLTGDPIYTSYVYTFVNDLGWESVPSDASETVQRNDNATVTITTPTTVPTGLSDDYGITLKRIYRAVSGSTGTVFKLVAEIPLAQAEYEDTLRDNQLGEELISQDWDLPPDDLRFILALPNGIMCGASRNRLCFSEKDRPHAWPIGYRLTTDTDITGLGNVDNTVVVGTQSFVYAAVGNSPGGYTMSKPGAPQACMTNRGVAYLLARGVIFPGPSGLMAARGPTEVVNLTEALFTEDQWKALEPETITGVAHDDIYWFSYGRPADPDVLLQTEFEGAVSDDISVYDRGPGTLDGGTVIAGAYEVDRNNSAQPFTPSTLDWLAPPAFTPDGVRPVTVEVLFEWIETPNVQYTPFFELLQNILLPSSTYLRFGFYENAGRVIVDRPALFDEYVTPEPVLGSHRHVAFVFAATEVRTYVEGQLVQIASASAVPSATEMRVRLGDPTGYSAGITNFLVQGVRVTNREVYTDNFVPPRTWASPRPSAIMGSYALDMRASGFGLIELGMHASAMATDLVDDALHFVLDAYEEPVSEVSAHTIDPDGFNLYEWDAGDTLMPYLWTGRLWELPYPRTMPLARVRAVDYDDLTVTVDVDLGTRGLAQDTPESDALFRLPERAVAPYSDMTVTFTGTSRLKAHAVGDDPSELSAMFGEG